jgi:hypothetical protein
MTLDERARSHAATLRGQLESIQVPEPRTVLRRARRRYRIGVVVGVVVLVAAIATPIAVIAGRDRSSTKIEAVHPHRGKLPPGGETNGSWASIAKDSAGLGNAQLDALTSDGATLLLAGRKPGAQDTTIWWSEDGALWTEADRSPSPARVTAIGAHSDTALAVSTPSGTASVWQSEDHGRHWDRIAHGDVFGKPRPNNRPAASVSGILWRDGWWIAYGGAANGYEAIWISRDGTEWRAALNSRSSGSIDGIVDTPDGSLMAYAVTGRLGTIDSAWITKDPTDWGHPVPLTTPNRYYLSSVTPDSAFGVGQNADRHGDATPLLLSADGGRKWVEDSTFGAIFPDAWIWTATKVANLYVLGGTTTSDTTQPGPPMAWISTDGKSWGAIPATFVKPTLPPTSIPQLPPTGALGLIAAVDQRIVMMGFAAELDRFYTFDVASETHETPSVTCSPKSVPSTGPSVRVSCSIQGYAVHTRVTVTGLGPAPLASVRTDDAGRASFGFVIPEFGVCAQLPGDVTVNASGGGANASATIAVTPVPLPSLDCGPASSR